MKLVLSAQDIKEITFGLMDERGLREERTVATQPEGYLAALKDTLDQWKISLSELTGMIVVTGPGSFTASRVSTTIANGLAFARGFCVVGIENPDRLPLTELLKQMPVEETTYVLPAYDRPPEITKSKSGGSGKVHGDNTRD